jgi:hypothetical protein
MQARADFLKRIQKQGPFQAATSHPTIHSQAAPKQLFSRLLLTGY